MIREIVIWPDPILAAPSNGDIPVEHVTNFGPELKELAADLVETMVAVRGAGLAAPQIGFRLAMVAIIIRDESGKVSPLVLVNPRIVERRGSTLRREGCLSLPGYFDEVRRPEWVRVEAQDLEGNRLEVAGDGALARALQHEIDHLHGVVFVDYLSPLKRQLAQTRFRKAKGRGLRYSAPQPPPSAA